MEIFNYVNSKETESLAKTAVYKSAWIKAWGLGNKEGGLLRGRVDNPMHTMSTGK